MKILICENEKPASNQLKKMIQNVIKEAEIIAEVETGEEALAILVEKNPDLVFLDVELADGSCFDTFDESDVRFPIIFTTAYDEYALKAFKLNCIDYLVKPFSEQDVKNAFNKYESIKMTFKKAIDKSNHQIKRVIGDFEEVGLEKEVEETPDGKALPVKYLKRLSIKNNGIIRLVDTSDIQWIESDGNYINIYTDKKKYFMRSTLNGFLKQLDPVQFYQIHKSIALNINFIDYVEETDRGDCVVVTKSNERLKMSRNFRYILEAI